MAIPGLNEPDLSNLDNPPLVVAGCQVQYEVSQESDFSNRLIELQKLLEVDYPIVEDLLKASVSFTTGQGAGLGVKGASQKVGAIFKTLDGKSLATVCPEFFAIETFEFRDWDDFVSRLASVTQSIDQLIGPQFFTRVGLRFVDQFEGGPGSTTSNWAEKINESLLGPILDESVGKMIKNCQQLIEFEFDEGLGVFLEHGMSHDAEGVNGNYILDIECFISGREPWESDLLIPLINRIYEGSLQIFQWAVTDGYFQKLKEA